MKKNKMFSATTGLMCPRRRQTMLIFFKPCESVVVLVDVEDRNSAGLTSANAYQPSMPVPKESVDLYLVSGGIVETFAALMAF